VLIRTWRLVAALLTALSMGVALAHLLELPAKIGLPGPVWLWLLQTLYPPGFGTAGAAFELGAVVSVMGLAFLVHHRRPAFGWTLAAALCLLVAHAVFWIAVAPVNETLVPLSAEALPRDWSVLRARWEFTHAARALLQLVALGCLLNAMLVEIPDERWAH